MTRRMSLRTVAYYTTMVSLVLAGLYLLIESHDAWFDSDGRKFMWKTLAAFLTLSSLAIMAFHPPD